MTATSTTRYYPIFLDLRGRVCVTLPGERIVTGTLATIAKRVRCFGIHPPAVIVAGEVATFGSALRPGASALAVGRSGRPPSKLAAAARKAPL